MGINQGRGALTYVTYIEKLFQLRSSHITEDTIEGVAFDSSSVDQKEIDRYFREKEDISYYSHAFRENDILSPYFPFLACIKEHFSKHNPSLATGLLDSIGVYSLHIPLFIEFFYEESYTRQEHILPNETLYEIQMLKEDMTRLLDYISQKHTFVFLLGSLHYASTSTVAFISHLLEQHTSLNILLVLTVDTFALHTINSEALSHLMNLIDRKEWLMPLKPTIVHHSFYDYMPDYDEDNLFKQMACDIQFCAYDDCINHGKIILANHQSLKGELGWERDYKLYNLYGWAYYCKRDYANALFYDHMAYTLADESENKLYCVESLRRLVYDYLATEDFKNAKRYLNILDTMMKEETDVIDHYRHEFLHYYYLRRVGLPISDDNVRLYEQIIKKAQQFKFKNHLGYYYTHPLFNKRTSGNLIITRFEDGIRIAKENGNMYQLAIGYYRFAKRLTHLNQQDEAYELFRQSNKVKGNIRDILPLVDVPLQLGLINMYREKHQQAHELFTEAAYLIYQTKDFEQLVTILYYIAMNALVAGEVHTAVDIMKKALELAKLLNIVQIEGHSLNLLYHIYMTALTLDGNKEQARNVQYRLNLWGVQNGNTAIEQFFDIYSDYIFGAREEGQDIMIKIQGIPFEHPEQRGIFEKFVLFEEIKYHKRHQQSYYKRLAKVLRTNWQDAYSVRTLNRLDALLGKLGAKEIQELELKLMDITPMYEGLIHQFHIEEKVRQLQRQANAIELLKVYKTTLMDITDDEQWVQSFEHFITGNTYVDRWYCRLVKKDSTKDLVQSSSGLALPEEVASDIYSTVINTQEAAMLNLNTSTMKMMRKIYGFVSVMYVPIVIQENKRYECLFVTSRPDHVLTQNDLSFFVLLGQEWANKVEGMNQSKELEALKEKLKRLSVTDLLTKVYNRQTFEKVLREEEVEDTSEYGIVFIDLDNFGYYNEFYTDEIGDEILKSFSKLIQRALPQSSIIGRYGGDEFVAFLRAVSLQEMTQFAERLRAKLNDHAFMTNILSHSKSMEMISPEVPLTCTIGIAYSESGDSTDLETLLTRSQKSVLEAKLTKKNCIVTD